LVYFVVIWYIFPRFGTLYQEKSGNPDVHAYNQGMLKRGFLAKFGGLGTKTDLGFSRFDDKTGMELTTRPTRKLLQNSGLPDGWFSNQKSQFG
jgi:hypothetical protein